ncbi:D-sedoheptulose 7-phosphate isomerase [Neolewinella aurantiaca]|uniref:Phosphoheptose isomerase n=1 Tax=Neolewinella aurantiaca TaxID=2602767 RepID=A0A5C7FWC7_9BACT|nr:D-sedoheptulose 7-phosphate isomerase [Neolewinella aurantiaca]TXF89941.1 D-sedoheptulose 7-phosphate isomerase [Neolewinella aurantiaca]
MQSTIRKNLQNAIDLKQQLLSDEFTVNLIVEMTEAIVRAYRNGRKVFFCGNGGSAADAQHLAAELSGRYYYDRPALFAEALHVNTSYITAVANDYSFDDVYARWITAIGQEGDVLIAMSTSGNSPNVVKAVAQANENGMVTIGFTGADGGALKEACDLILRVPSTDTPRIQECHMHIGHTLCEIVEATIFPR